MRRYKEPVERNCAKCGNPFLAWSGNHRYCAECQREKKNARNSKFAELVYKCPRRDKGPTIPSKPSRSIEEILKIADKNGISYGKAVWLLEGR